jgi:hypothetical protein
MIKPVLITVTAAMLLSGCARISESRFNPLNWFGASTEEQIVQRGSETLVPASRRAVTVDNRALMDSITTMAVERIPGGALVRATGIAPRQGFFNADLVPVAVSGGQMTLAFRAQGPREFTETGPVRAREITAARFFTTQELGGIRTIRVEAATNARSSRR